MPNKDIDWAACLDRWDAFRLELQELYREVSPLALGPRQNLVDMALWAAAADTIRLHNPRRVGNRLRLALRALGQWNPDASEKVRAALQDCNQQQKTWEAYFGRKLI